MQRAMGVPCIKCYPYTCRRFPIDTQRVLVCSFVRSLVAAAGRFMFILVQIVTHTRAVGFVLIVSSFFSFARLLARSPAAAGPGVTISFATEGTRPKCSARWTCLTSSWREKTTSAGRSAPLRTSLGSHGSGELLFSLYSIVNPFRTALSVQKHTSHSQFQVVLSPRREFSK